MYEEQITQSDVKRDEKVVCRKKKRRYTEWSIREQETEEECTRETERQQKTPDIER